MKPCSICKAETSYESQDEPLCHQCAVLVLEYVKTGEFFTALQCAKKYIENINKNKKSSAPPAKINWIETE